MLLLLLLVAGVTNTLAQDVTMSPSTGSLMAALTQQGESGSAGGWSSTWKHKQLALTFTVADFCNVTQGGEIQNPAGNMAEHNGQLVVSTGQSPDLFMSATLPKGFRFTGYEIVVLNNLGGVTILDTSHSNCNMILFETDDLSRNVGTTQMVYNNANDYNYYTTIRDEIYANNPHYLAVARKEGKPNGDFRMAQQNEGNTEYVITRTSMAADGSDMSNHLYFRLAHASNVFFGVTIKSARFYFTAEGNFTENVAPEAKASSITTTGVNYMNAPFTTGKLDLGDVKRDANGHYTYNYRNVRDLTANNVIYEDGAEGTAKKLPDEPGAGGIFGVYNGGQYYYGLKNNTYFVECPTTAMTAGGQEGPIGFRITGAKVHCAYGQDQSSNNYPVTKEYEGFYIYSTVTRNNTTYNLYYRSNGNTTQDVDNATVWFMDEDGYIRTSGGTYLTWSGTGATRTPSITTNKNQAKTFTKVGSYINFNENNTTYYLQGQASGSWNITLGFRFNSNNVNNKATRLNSGTTINISGGTVTNPKFTAKPYTLTVYKADGETIEETVNVGDGEGKVKNATVELTNLNNDAIKFKVEGLQGDDAKALVTVELTMQALDPYIDQMSVVCYDPESDTNPQTETIEPLRISQGFTASDFSVSGGEFNFFLPGECLEHTVQIKFEELYSHYADETYTVEKDGFNGSASHFSRYNFVKSQHFNQFGETTNNIYTNKSEAANPQKDRVSVAEVGSAAFKFNNAAEVNAGQADFFIEYPFSVESYNGSFDELKFTVSEDNQTATKYVFTTDETGYNIAPTTATQHRVYAYYTMVINVKSQTYDPVVTFNPIYAKDKTLYDSNSTDDFYGVTVTATDAAGKPGYSSTDKIFQAIGNKIKESMPDDITEEEKIKEYVEAEMKKILYLDFSDLAGIFQVTTGQHGSMEDYANTNAANCLIFLPVNATAPNNNVAYKTPEGSFRAAHSIILTDKQPFYSPYNIQVDAAEKIEYKRLLTTDKYGKPQNASLILPFALTLDNGKHTNADDKTSFTVHTLQATNAFTKQAGSDYAFAPALTDVTKTTANVPYLVHVDSNSTTDGVTFTVSQSGGTITATTAMDETDYTFSGNEPSGTADGTTYYLKMKGTYSGQKVPKANEIFYFANNEFVNSIDYKYNAPINVRPFRAYFATTKKEAASTAAKLASFQLIFEEGMGESPTGIKSLDKNPDLMVASGNGMITLTSTIDQNVRVNSTSGVLVNNAKMQAGETRTINVPAGIYVINGVKIIVK